ncbi:hypothetical protein [Gilliamella sp. ESL0254]|uniref:hypothetical protein n=1 Tax=Gilliamella sp. ESL0254 TaxID=2705035 RepID=UPI0015803ADE|nr:hypothetical protein [Gilliamella sp. ESL0254]NUF26939.1 hypothetical protein [Gilliamella sp. ESL0254]
MKQSIGLEDSYNKMSDKVSQNRLERNKLITEGQSNHDVKGKHHTKETQKIRKIYKEENDDQLFIDPNPVQQEMKDTKNKTFTRD